MRKPNCEKCKKKKCTETGTPCKKVEKYLHSIGVRARDWIRPKVSSQKRENGEWREIPFSSMGDFPEDKNPYFGGNI